MKVVVRGSPAMMSLLGRRRTASKPAAHLLSRGAAGRARIGMLDLDVLKEFKGRVKFNELNSAADIFDGSQRRGPDLSLEFTDGRVTRIEVHSPGYKTDQGVGPGDSTIALANHHTVRWVTATIAEDAGLKIQFRCANERIISVLLF